MNFQVLYSGYAYYFYALLFYCLSVGGFAWDDGHVVLNRSCGAQGLDVVTVVGPSASYRYCEETYLREDAYYQLSVMGVSQVCRYVSIIVYITMFFLSVCLGSGVFRDLLYVSSYASVRV